MTGVTIMSSDRTMTIDPAAPVDRAAPTQPNTPGRPRSRFRAPRGLTAGTLVAIALSWALYKIIPGSSLLSAQVQTGIFVGLLLLAAGSPRAKVLLARTFQRFALNPLIR